MLYKLQNENVLPKLMPVNHYIKTGLGNGSIFTVNQTLSTCLKISHRLHSD